MLNLRFYTRSKTRVKRKYDFNTGDFDTGEGGEKNFPFKNFNEREKQRNPADFAVSSRLFIIVRLEDLDIVRSTSVHFVSRVYREEKEKRKRGRIRSVAFGCSSSMERRIIIRGIQPSPPSFLSSILSVGLGLPRVTLSSNGISDPSSSSSFDFTTLASSEYFQRSRSPTHTLLLLLHLHLLLCRLLVLVLSLFLLFFRPLLPFFYSLARTLRYAT